MAALTPAVPAQQVELLPDPPFASVARPLTMFGAHTYAAIWAYVNHHPRPAGRRRSASASSRSPELLLVRDDGLLLFGRADSSGQSLPPGDGAASPADCFLPSRPPLPADRLWSGAGVQRYLDGRRPAPADVFRGLVAVIDQFVDFTGSLAAPSLMAEFFAVYLLTTWFSPAFPFLGLLWLTGDNGAGKSRLLALLARLAHLGLYLPVPPPPAALRSLAGLGASLAVDDADFLGPRPNNGHWSVSTRHALLLAGRQRGAMLPVTLVEPGSLAGARHTRQLDVSGPRIFASVHPPHPSIARYFVVVPLVRTPLAPLAAADPADPAAWPAGLTLCDLVDDLWALSLSRLRELPPHLPLAAQAAASPTLSLPPPHAHTHTLTHALPLLGSALQPWHALLAVASWLSSTGVPGLLDRLLGLAQVYHASRPAAETADLTVLALRGLLECVSNICERALELDLAASVAQYDRAGGTVDQDEDDGNDDDTGIDANVANDANDAKRQKELRNLERRIARADWARAHPDDSDAAASRTFPPSFAFTSAMVLDAMRHLAADLAPDLPLDSLTPNLVGRILRQLRLMPHRSASLRVWAVTSVGLTRLARAYGVPIPSDLAEHFAATESSHSAPPP